MKGKTLKYIILLATVSVVGVFLVQFVFIRSSYSLSEKQFQESTSVALKEVAWQIMSARGAAAIFDSITPVEVITENTFLVNVGVEIEKVMLKENLIRELKKHEIYSDFEFAVYSPSQKQMGESILVHINSEEESEECSSFVFPQNANYTDYFGVHFPDRSSFFFSRLNVWYFLTVLLVVVVIFFGYTLSVIIRQRQLSEIQKNFINNLTHELKTPISSIALAANVINDDKIVESPERLSEYARIIKEQTNRLSKNVEKVLDLATIEKSRMYLKLENIELKGLLDDVLAVFSRSKAGVNACVLFSFEDADLNVRIDKFHFSNLVLNILENAAKYCNTKPEIKIEVEAKQKYICLSFIDNGIGIPREYRKKVFKKFYRVPTGNVHNVKGFGLGLDYVHKIVKAHGWKIKISDNPAGGSIFLLTIPKIK